MVLGILIATITAPGLLGSQEAIRQSQSKEKREEHRARRCNLIATCVKSSQKSREINGRSVVLRNGRLWINTGTEDGNPLGHPYAGYYLPYPDSNYEGLVTTITDVAPIMNWVYVDKETHHVRYGVRADAQPNLTGPFDCTRQDRRLTFDGWEGWCAVEEIPGLWALYFDLDDDGLRDKVTAGTRVLEIELQRKEKRFQRETEARRQDQTTKRAVDATEDAPVDQPLGPEALVQNPGVVDIGAQREESAEEESAAQSLPFRIPKSIFDNPPALLGESIFQSPLTPPPAYTTTARPDTTTPNKGSSDERSTSQTRDEPTSMEPQPSPPSTKRVTPKMSRTSGTRSLAQAQMFEALSTSKTTSAESRSSQRVSRAGSNASSASRYSSDGAESKIPIRSKTNAVGRVSPTPAPLVSKATKESSLSSKSMNKIQISRQDSISGSVQLRSPRKTSAGGFKDPAVFSTSSQPSLKTSRRTPQSQSSRQSPVSRSSSSHKSLNPPFHAPTSVRRQVTAPIATTRSTSVSSSTSKSRDTGRTSLAETMTSGKTNQGMRHRVGSVSSATSRGAGVAMASPRLRDRAKAMGEGEKRVGRKTKSALFREIDELVGLEGRSAKGEGTDMPKGVKRDSAGRVVPKESLGKKK